MVRNSTKVFSCTNPSSLYFAATGYNSWFSDYDASNVLVKASPPRPVERVRMTFNVASYNVKYVRVTTSQGKQTCAYETCL